MGSNPSESNSSQLVNKQGTTINLDNSTIQHTFTLQDATGQNNKSNNKTINTHNLDKSNTNIPNHNRNKSTNRDA